MGPGGAEAAAAATAEAIYDNTEDEEAAVGDDDEKQLLVDGEAAPVETADDNADLEAPVHSLEGLDGAMDADEALRQAAMRRDLKDVRVSRLELSVLHHLDDHVRMHVDALRYILPRDMHVTGSVHAVMTVKGYVFGRMERTKADVMLWCRCKHAKTCEHRRE